MWFLVELCVMGFWTLVNIFGIGGLYLAVHYFQAPGTNAGGKFVCVCTAILICSGYLFALGVFLRNRGWWPGKRRRSFPTVSEIKGTGSIIDQKEW